MKIPQNYTYEIINTKANVLLAILAVSDLLAIVISFIQFLNEEFGIVILLLILIITLPLLVIWLYDIYINILNTKKNQEKVQDIIKNGIKVNGTIIDIVNQYTYEAEESYFKKNRLIKGKYRDRYENRYDKIAIVEYEHLCEKYSVKSPSLNIGVSYLSSKDVDVYIYNDECYIDNYKLDIKNIENDKISRKREILWILLIMVLFAILFCLFMMKQ